MLHMKDDLALQQEDEKMLDEAEVLSLLKVGNPQSFNSLRASHPSWTPILPANRAFDFKRAQFAYIDFRGMDLSGIDFSWADLSHAKLDGANLDKAKLVGSNLFGVSIIGASFCGATGLFGENRALYSPYVESFNSGAEQSTYMEKGDHVPWSLLRSISTFRVFGASYFTIAVLVIYASWVEWVNTTAYSWATIVPADGGIKEQLRGVLLNKLPLIEVAPHFGIQILMVISLALGATIYHLFCPAFIKENSESRWTRELNQSLIEYRAGNASYPLARSLAFFFYGIGGLYTLVYLFVRVVGATAYFLRGG
jgi:hypothetical protein